VTLAYPIDIAREIDRKWQRRVDVAPLRARVPPQTDAAVGDCCPVCRVPPPIAPIASAFLGDGLIHHYWLCTSCDHEWITAVRMPS
jgi:hypothetical protein